MSADSAHPASSQEGAAAFTLPSTRRAVRWACGLFLFLGGSSLLGAVTMADSGWSAFLRVLFALAIFGVAVLLWKLPWHRWPSSSLLSIVPLAFSMLMAYEWLIGMNPYVYPLGFILTYVWIGMALPRWVPWAAAPLLLLAYVWPKLGETAALQATVIAVPTCLLVAEVIGPAMHRQRRSRDSQARRADLFHRVAQAARHINSLEPAAVLDEITTASSQLGFEMACIVRVSARNQQGELASVFGMPATETGQILAIDQGIVGAVLREGREQEWHRQRMREEGCPILAESDLSTVLAEPVWNSGELAAVLVVGHYRDTAITDDEKAALEILALEAAAALSNAELFDVERRQSAAYRDQSRQDALTGLGNRHLMNLLLPKIAPDDVLLLLDLDHFKSVNDRLGHDGGDQVLVTFAEFLRRELREGDIGIRIGGEEFMVLMPRAGDNVRDVAGRLLDRWRAQSPVTTFSMGLAVHRTEWSPEETFKRADEALYAAKREGRDRLSVAGESETDHSTTA